MPQEFPTSHRDIHQKVTAAAIQFNCLHIHLGPLIEEGRLPNLASKGDFLPAGIYVTDTPKVDARLASDLHLAIGDSS